MVSVNYYTSTNTITDATLTTDAGSYFYTDEDVNWYYNTVATGRNDSNDKIKALLKELNIQMPKETWAEKIVVRKIAIHFNNFGMRCIRLDGRGWKN